MNTNELRCILTRDPRMREKLIDVFAIDQFKQFVKKNTLMDGVYVCNDQISEMPGNHWFLIYVDKRNVNFIDSFAQDPKFYSIQSEIKSNKSIKKIDFQLQSIFSDVCGEYTVFFSYHLCRGKSLEQILEYFSRSNQQANDECVRNFIYKLFPGHKRL